jgi:alanyl-tRNA synthetase
MKPMSGIEVRQTFLDYFTEHNHAVIPSSSLVPANDPTLLFTNAGMVQFKEVFLGLEQRPYQAAATSQKCMRVSGKHNDLENVGPSPRHHTFFEMLGNFSFGAYFKSGAIRHAYRLLTEVYGLPADRLAFTVYEADDEAYRIWVEEIGVPAHRVARMGPKTNFWQMAETGPCGPTSEIHWDYHPELGEGSIVPSLIAEDDRFLEIWNLVFMQFNRLQPDADFTGEWDEPLPAPGVDTGMGLERIVSILQNKDNNYDTDLFAPIIQAINHQAQINTSDTTSVPQRVIADHVRAAAFLIADGVGPGAKGRSSVCRLVIRRASRFGRKLGFEGPFLATIVDSVIDVLGGHYHELVDKVDLIKRTITLEEERFHRTLDRGLEELDLRLDQLRPGDRLGGEEAFYLKATLGLPIQVTQDVALESGFDVDMDAYFAAEDAHARASGGGQAMGVIESSGAYGNLLDRLVTAGALPSTGVDYNPYSRLETRGPVLAMLVDDQPTLHAMIGDRVGMILPATGFYVEAGGQVSDHGTIHGPDWVIEVDEMRQPVQGLIVHYGELIEGNPTVGDKARAVVDAQCRRDVIRNHTGTHLVHAALRNALGSHVEQRGSLVAPDRLRFDFTHDEKVHRGSIERIERAVNEIVLADYLVAYEVKPLTEARAEGAMALFGEKYGDQVRTVSISSNGQRYSYELCGGVHVSRTAEIGALVITNETSVSAGIRRIEAVTGRYAYEYMAKQRALLLSVADQVTTSPPMLPQRIQMLTSELEDARKALENLQRQIARNHMREIMSHVAQNERGIHWLVAEMADANAQALRDMADFFREQVKQKGVMAVFTVVDDHPQLVLTVTDDLVKQGVHAGKLIKEVAAEVGGSGGGRPGLAQAGGNQLAGMDAAKHKARALFEALGS